MNSEDQSAQELKNNQKDKQRENFVLLNSTIYQNQHMFLSEVKRFIPTNNFLSEDIGPGVYEVAQDIKRKTFNAADKNFSQDARNCALVINNKYIMIDRH